MTNNKQRQTTTNDKQQQRTNNEKRQTATNDKQRQTTKNDKQNCFLMHIMNADHLETRTTWTTLTN